MDMCTPHVPLFCLQVHQYFHSLLLFHSGLANLRVRVFPLVHSLVQRLCSAPEAFSCFFFHCRLLFTSTTPSHFGLATHCGQVGHSPCSHPCFRGLGVSFSQFGLLPLFLSLATVTDCLSGPFFFTLGVPMVPGIFFTGHQGFGWAGWVPMGCSLSFASGCASLPLFPSCYLRPLIPHMGPHLFVLSTAGYGLLYVFMLCFLSLHGSSQFCVGWAPWDFRDCF